MREIKFRAWDKLGKRLIYIQGFIRDGNSIRIWYFKGSDDECVLINESFNISNVIIDQFTELKDKNGKDIYEGDIEKSGRYIKWFNDLNYDGGGAKHPGFYFNKSHSIEDDGELSYHYDLNDIEIIGNIHENPELIP